MKNQEKQQFRSSGLLALLGLVGFSSAIIAAPWNREIQDSRVEAARQKAEVVGYQVVQIYREAAKQNVALGKSGGRNPASLSENVDFKAENVRTVGTMGVDPWGEPYHYRILSADRSAGKVRILVWSAGPNKRVETKDLDSDDVSMNDQPVYAGDDMGVLLSVTQN